MGLKATLGAVLGVVPDEASPLATLRAELDGVRASIAEKREYSRKLRNGEVTERRLAAELSEALATALTSALPNVDNDRVKSQAAAHLSVADALRAKRFNNEQETDELLRQASYIEDDIRFEEQRQSAISEWEIFKQMEPLARQLTQLNQQLARNGSKVQGSPGVVAGLDEWLRRAEFFDWQRATRAVKSFRPTGQKTARVRFIEHCTVATDGIGLVTRKCAPGDVVEFSEEAARSLVRGALAVQDDTRASRR